MSDLILSANGAEPTQPPPVPQPNYNITPEGMVITLPIGPNTAMQHLIPMQVMREILKKWRDVERVNEGMQRIAQDALRTKR